MKVDWVGVAVGIVAGSVIGLLLAFLGWPLWLVVPVAFIASVLPLILRGEDGAA